MKWNIWLFLTLLYFNCSGQHNGGRDLIEEIQRVRISESSAKFDVRNYGMDFSGDTLILWNTNYLNSDGAIEVLKLNSEFEVESKYRLKLNKENQKKLKRYSLADILFVDRFAYLLFGKYMVVIEMDSNLKEENQSIYKLNNKYRSIDLLDDVVYLHTSTKPASGGKFSGLFTVSTFNGEVDVEVKQFAIDNYFFVHFENLNFFEIDTNSIYYLCPDKNVLQVFDVSSNELFDYETCKNWIYPSSEEATKFNKYSDFNAHKLYPHINEIVVEGLSFNTRIDHVGGNFYTISYLPGKDYSLGPLIYNVDVWKIENKVPKFVKSTRTQTAEWKTTEDGEYYFGFCLYKGNAFTYNKGKRYQLSIEPRAIWSDENSAARIKKEQNQSLLNNQFELCLYIGTLDLD